jgi:hypothetical protein
VRLEINDCNHRLYDTSVYVRCDFEKLAAKNTTANAATNITANVTQANVTRIMEEGTNSSPPELLPPEEPTVEEPQPLQTEQNVSGPEEPAVETETESAEPVQPAEEKPSLLRRIWGWLTFWRRG